ncbi:Mevalonate kinase [uncultured archaeon]|nr:Mevalonate kinase [uncultured archaeon]
MRIRCSAPGKVILFGEHYVVYGASGLVAAIGPDNEIEMEGEPAEGRGTFEYRTTIKAHDITVALSDPPDSVSSHAYAALYLKRAKQWPALQNLRIRARVKKIWPLKGVGNSASLGACIGAGLRALAGEKTGAALIFEDAQTADEVAHGGRPSGIDAAAAAYGGVLEFEKDFSNPLRPKIGPGRIAEMKGVEFLLIDTFQPASARGNTGELVANFAKNNGVGKKPGEMTADEREAVFAPYLPLFLHAKRALQDGEWDTVGRLMDENHRLLAQKGVSDARIEKAVAICKSFGALGAKLSGAGGAGGVVIALARKEKSAGIQEALAVEGFGCYPFRIAKEGARAEKE